MTDEGRAAAAVARPSKLAITKMLAEVEARRRRAVRYSLVVLLLPLAVGAALLVYTFNAVRLKLEEKRRLDDEIAAARGEVDRLKEERARLESEKASIAGTVKAVEYAVSEAADSGESTKALEARIQNVIASNPYATEAAPFVFIHIHDERQRRQEARAASAALRRAGFDVKDIRLVPSVTVPAAEVRYFRPEDRALADKAVTALNNAKLQNAGAKLSKTPNAKPGQIELWFAPVESRPPTPSTPNAGASRARFEREFFARLRKDAGEQLRRAGDKWQLQPLGYFYSDQSRINMAVVDVMEKILKVDGIELLYYSDNRLRSIPPTMTVEETITLMEELSSSAKRP